MNKKNLIIISVSALLLTGGVLLLKPVSADEQSTFSPLIQRLVEKFNLNQDEVTNVVTEFRNENRQKRQEELSSKLQTAVDEGKITSEQKDAILAKMAEHQPGNRDENRAEMQAWADEVGIDLHDLMGHGPRDGMGKGEGFGDRFGSDN